jgi:putative NIF3 family GTP cyclohydrolase 1 type 2
MMARRCEVEAFLQALLQPDRFRDYGPNGLQIEGRSEIHRVVSGVTAGLALIDAAIAAGADAIVVHHGLFWRGHDGRLVGWLKERVARLMAAQVNLFAYHLPLDAHPQFGNNAQLGLKLGWVADGRFGEQDLGFIASMPQAADAAALAASLRRITGRDSVLVPGDGR